MTFRSGTNDSARPGGAEETATPRRDVRWMSINEACAMLGVDQSTLRRWSDAGKVPVFRTPGGHRRYAEADLRSLLGNKTRRPERPQVTRQEMTDRSLSAFEEGFWQGARARRWFRAFSPNKHDELRLLGRRLIDLAVRYAAAVSPESADRASFLDEGRQIGEHYGASSARAGLTSAEAVEAFLYFRLPVVRSMVGMIDEQGLAAKRAARVFVDIGQFMDQVLLSMVSAHEQTGQAGLSLAHQAASAASGTDYGAGSEG
jgi:excisionase family DNA binding protein